LTGVRGWCRAWRCRGWPALAGDRHQPIELLLAGRALLNDADGIYDPNWYKRLPPAGAEKAR
jgi:hypothetical protein